jgi:hypothetical protein
MHQIPRQQTPLLMQLERIRSKAPILGALSRNHSRSHVRRLNAISSAVRVPSVETVDSTSTALRAGTRLEPIVGVGGVARPILNLKTPAIRPTRGSVSGGPGDLIR